MRYRGNDLTPVDELRRYGALVTRARAGRLQGISYATDHVDGAQPWRATTDAMVRSVAPDRADQALITHVEGKLERLVWLRPESGRMAVRALLFAIVGRGEEWCDGRRADLCVETACELNGAEWRAFWLGVLPEAFGRAIATRVGEWAVGLALREYEAA